MFNSNNGYSLADLAAVTGNGGFGNGFGGDGAWILALFVLFALGGWGGFGGFGGMGMGGMWPLMMNGGFGFGLEGAFPWLLASNANNQNATNAGFDSLALGNTLGNIQGAITSGFGDTALGIAGINQNICQTGSGITAAVTNGFAQSEIADNARQIANMQQAFNSQTATTAAINGVQTSLADCCCENRLGLANLNSTILSENCADRAALSDGIRDVLAATQAQTQTILDKLCQQEIDALKDRNAELRTQVQMQNLAASQTAQTAALTADNAAQTQYIVNRVAPYPIPAYQVGNPFGYPYYSNGYGCGYGYNNLVA